MEPSLKAELYDKTKQSLLATSKGHPDRGIEIIKQIQAKIKQIKQQGDGENREVCILQIICLNNLACAYNKKGKFRASLYQLHLASQIQSHIFKEIGTSGCPQQVHHVATTHSNMCAVLSQMGNHQKAYRQINEAIELILNNTNTPKSDALIVFYFNCAVQLQHLGRLNEAQKLIDKGHNLAFNSPDNKQMLIRFSQLSLKLEQKIKKRQKKIAKMMMKNIKNSTIDISHNFNKRGKSLMNISRRSIQNMQNQSGFNISQQCSDYDIKMPRVVGVFRNARVTEYPNVRMPSFVNKQQASKTLNSKTVQNNKFISLYQPRTREKRIPQKQRLSLKKKQDTLLKLINQQN